MQKKIIFFRFFFCKSKNYSTFVAEFGLYALYNTGIGCKKSITYIKNIIMTKAELVNAIAIKTGYDKTTIMNVVESAMDNIKSTVAAGETVYLRGFGSFSTKVRKQKVARNITKKESIIVPEHKIPAFKPSDAFAEILK